MCSTQRSTPIGLAGGNLTCRDVLGNSRDWCDECRGSVRRGASTLVPIGPERMREILDHAINEGFLTREEIRSVEDEGLA